MLTKEEGGRHTPFFKGYRPQFYFRTTDVTGMIELPEGIEMVMPGDNIKMVVELINPIAMEEGLRFAIREGGRTVGAGVVAKILSNYDVLDRKRDRTIQASSSIGRAAVSKTAGWGFDSLLACHSVELNDEAKRPERRRRRPRHRSMVPRSAGDWRHRGFLLCSRAAPSWMSWVALCRRPAAGRRWCSPFRIRTQLLAVLARVARRIAQGVLARPRRRPSRPPGGPRAS